MKCHHLPAATAAFVLSTLFVAAPGCGSATPRSEVPAVSDSEPAAAAPETKEPVAPDASIAPVAPEREGEYGVRTVPSRFSGRAAESGRNSPDSVLPPQDAGPAPLVQLGRLSPESLPNSARRERTQPGTALAAKAQRFRPPFGERELLADSRATWRARRSYDGAPPVLPHSAAFGKGSKTCLDCHETGMTIGNRVAHPMSHAPLGSCLQCHVEGKSSVFPEAAGRLTTPNAFRGTRNETQGERAFEGAPPLIPHTLRMRANCLACHGEFGWPGIRIDHTQRGNCVQCHLTERESAE